VEQAIGFLENKGSVNELKQLLDDWADRAEILMKAQNIMDPVLNVRKSILEILKDASKGKYLELLNGSIRDCWLTAAKVESR
jgi:hypothetical protein